MTDYTRSTGSSGTMMIRDTGSIVEFWLIASSATFNHELPWGYTVNGVTDNTRQFDFHSGGSWQKLASFTVTTSQTVTFRLFDSGTGGLGGPTTFSQFIDRADVPQAPDPVTFSSLTSTSVVARSFDNGNGGAPITLRSIARSTQNSLATATIFDAGSDFLITFSPLSPGTTYYFWARVWNSQGVSNWSVVRSVKTLNVPSQPSKVSLTNIKQSSVDASFTDGANNGAIITSRQIAYNTVNTTTGATIISSDGSTTITGLLPGRTYYFWARTHNSVGDSSWSPVSSAKLIAGARVKVGAVWKDAVPYVRVGGVWKIARPWGKVSGSWRETL